MTQFSSQNVLITGGASGIGYLVAARAIDKGATVTIWDIDETAMERAARSLAGDVHTYKVDITNRKAVYATAKKVRKDVGVVDILINNAGIVSGDSLLDLSDEKIERTFQVNTLALFWMTRAFLPDMVERNRGHIVNIASAAGYVGVPKLADYCSSKSAAVGFDEALRAELTASGSDVRTTAVCPFFINTGMFAGAQTKVPWLLPILDEHDVADKIVRAIEKNQQRLFLPGIVQALLSLKSLPTPMVDYLMRLFGVSESMDDFQGRQQSR